ncbi:MAG: tetratricopeptide repeat protein, partial [Chloroflexi bacterium]|nr:tetratricopeptide repeat protein [Chloroflexota bacterium]
MKLLVELSESRLRLGNPDEARDQAQRAHKLATKLGDQAGVAASLRRLGSVHHEVGDFPDAIAALQQSLVLSQALNDQ